MRNRNNNKESRFDDMDDNFDINYNSRSRKPSNSSVLEFFVGIILFFLGVYLITQNTTLYTNTSALSDFMGFNMPFGLVLLPLIFGIGILFFNNKNVLGWLLFVFGILTVLLGILMVLKIKFKPIPLYYGILMYGMTAAGAGLFLRSLFGKKK